MAIRASSISPQTFDLEFHFDSYDWTFPPDLIISGSSLRPSLRDIGLDDSWDANDRSCLAKVLARLARMLQASGIRRVDHKCLSISTWLEDERYQTHEERLKVATLQNERIQFEYSTLHEREEMDCGVIFSDGPTRVLFAVPFNVSYRYHGRDMHVKAVVKVQYTISALMENNITSVQSNIEFLSEFNHPEITSKLSPIGFEESIHDYIENVQRIIVQEFEKREKGQKLRTSLIEELATTFRRHILECDTEKHYYISMLFNTPSHEASRQDTTCSAIVTVLLTDNFPEEYPKIAFGSPVYPIRVQSQLHNPHGVTSGGGGNGGGGNGGDTSHVPDLLTDVITMPLYSPRWDAKRMVEAIWEFLWEEIPRFHERAVAHPSNGKSNGSSGHLNMSSGSLTQSR
ncbi:hypothetical protein BGW42_003153 [Actinomortierella wolfii]|nr:hypothetical protein BGW42_003153 [Actinomortierella wolfii]